MTQVYCFIFVLLPSEKQPIAINKLMFSETKFNASTKEISNNINHLNTNRFSLGLIQLTTGCMIHCILNQVVSLYQPLALH